MMTATAAMDALLARLRQGRRGAIAKAITLVENDPGGARKLVKRIFPHTGNAAIIGVTGPAGAGKSSLINKAVVAMNRMGARPAVLAVDPTSHMTGGAILGDRVRMAESADSGTYIRSIASRGATGAVSASLRNSIRVLEYAGFDPIIIESVGAGQTEIEISRIADVTVVVFNPHTGDSIQAIKAGLTEIGDIYIVNKCDLEGAGRLYDAIRDFVVDRPDAQEGGGGRRGQVAGSSSAGPVVLKTSIKRGATIAKLARVLMEMAATATESSGSGQSASKRRMRLDAEIREMVMSNLRARVDEVMETDRDAMLHLDRLVSGKSDPFDAGDRITRSLLRE